MSTEWDGSAKKEIALKYQTNYCREICAKWRPPIRWEPARISATWGCGGRDRAGRKEKRDFKESGLFLAVAAAEALLIRKAVEGKGRRISV